KKLMMCPRPYEPQNRNENSDVPDIECVLFLSRLKLAWKSVRNDGVTIHSPGSPMISLTANQVSLAVFATVVDFKGHNPAHWRNWSCDVIYHREDLVFLWKPDLSHLSDNFEKSLRTIETGARRETRFYQVDIDTYVRMFQ
ncbi:hypothetical protein STEG23_005752, partial [Scotinomys teguina]